MIGIIVVLLMLIADKGAGNVSLSNMSTLSYILMFLVGVLASATMVVPGISGSFTLMLIGYYEPVLNVVNELTSFKNVGENILIMLPFILGIIIGIVVIAKIIEFLLNKYHDATYYVIIGFVLSSIISVFYQVLQFEFNLVHLIIGIIIMLIDAFAIYKIFDN